MEIFDDLSRRAKDVAAIATEKAKDVAELAKINMAIATEQRNLEKSYRTIGEWFISEYSGEIPEAVKDLVDEVNAAKDKIANLESGKPNKAEPAEEVPQTNMKKCPICGAVSDSKFCPQCGAPMGE